MGSNTVLVGTAGGVVKSRTNKRLPPGERWDCNLLDEAHGSELAPHALEDDGGRIGIRAPHRTVHLPPLVPEFRHVRRAPLRRTNFEQFGHTDNCTSCTNARAGRKQAVEVSFPHGGTVGDDHRRDWSGRGSVLPGSLGNRVWRSLRGRDIALRTKGGQPLAPPASTVLESDVRSKFQEDGSCGSAIAACDSPLIENVVFKTGDRDDGRTSRTTGRGQEAQGTTNNA